VLGRVGREMAILDGSVSLSPREADVPVLTAAAVSTGAGAAQCVWIAQPTREAAGLLI
jgi:hypothetical protein